MKHSVSKKDDVEIDSMRLASFINLKVERSLRIFDAENTVVRNSVVDVDDLRVIMLNDVCEFESFSIEDILI